MAHTLCLVIIRQTTIRKAYNLWNKQQQTMFPMQALGHPNHNPPSTPSLEQTMQQLERPPPSAPIISTPQFNFMSLIDDAALLEQAVL
jgi:hypothetical protein